MISTVVLCGWKRSSSKPPKMERYIPRHMDNEAPSFTMQQECLEIIHPELFSLNNITSCTKIVSLCWNDNKFMPFAFETRFT